MLFLVLFLATICTTYCQETSSLRTKMALYDDGRLYRINLGMDLNDYQSSHVSVPDSAFVKMIEYDFVDDRVYMLIPYKMKSIFLNGTDLRTHFDWNIWANYEFALDPYEKLLFAHKNSAGRQSTIFVTDTNGTNEREIITRESYMAEIGVDYERKHVYWTDSSWDGPCPCIYRVNYDGSGLERYEGVYQARQVRAIDFNTLTMYSHGNGGLKRIHLGQGSSEIIQETDDVDIFHSETNTVLDPKTNRLFVTNRNYFNYVYVFSTNGTLLGRLNWLPMREMGDKLVRFNPL